MMHKIATALATSMAALILVLGAVAPVGAQAAPTTTDPGPRPAAGDGGGDGTGSEGTSPAATYMRQLDELNQELEDLDDDIAAAGARRTELRREGARLEEEATSTSEAIDDARARVGALEDILRDRIAGTYMAEGTEVDTLDPAVDDGLIRRIYAEARSETDERLARRLRDQRARLEDERDHLADLDEAVADQARELDTALDALQDQKAERVEATARLQAAIEEAQRQALIKAAEAQRRAEEAAERARLAQIAAEEAAAQKAADLQAFLDAAAEAQREAATAALEAGDPLTSIAPGGIDLCTVGGITVSCLISRELGEMIIAATADGVALTGGGYRSTQRQMELRAAHCAGDVFGRPASACSPPTARPGSSMHEVGLAIDFESCASHGTACWMWLHEHAAEHGFENLPSEPWHWSTNGS